MSRALFRKVLAVTWVGLAAGVGAAEVPDPEAVTEARIRAVGGRFYEEMIEHWVERSARERAGDRAGELEFRYPAASECAVPDGALPLSAVALAAAWEELGGEPAALADLEVDAWGRPLEIYSVEAALPQQPRLLIRSAGANGSFERSSYEAGHFVRGGAEDDIVWSFGRFCRRTKPVDCCDARADEASVDDAPPSADREAQRQTMTDMRNLGTALFSWLTDQVDDTVPGAEEVPAVDERAPCPPVAALDEGGAAEPGKSSSPATHYGVLGPSDAIEPDRLEAILRPSETVFYIREVPRLDGWGAPIEVYLHGSDLLAEKVITIRSAGRDGEFETDCYEIGPFDPDDADQDIVWADGFFVRWPGANAAR